MALQMNPNAQLVLFTKLFGATDPVTVAVKYLIGVGVTFKQSLYTLEAIYKLNGKEESVHTHNCTTAIGNLVSGSPADVVVNNNKVGIRGFIHKVLVQVAPGEAKQFNLLPSASLVGYNPETVLAHNAFFHPSVDAAVNFTTYTIDTESFSTASTQSPISVSTTTGGTTTPGYALTLTGKGPNIIETIKVIRSLTGWSLFQAKKIVDAVPVILVAHVTHVFANSFASALAAVGATSTVWLVEKLEQHEKYASELANVLPIAQPSELVPTHSWVPGQQFATGGTIDTAKPAKKSAGTVNKVVALSEAEALGQKVKGTSPDSIYHTIAVSPRVKVASRIYKNGTVSVRVETKNPTSEEMFAIKQVFSWKQDSYGSIHIQPSTDCPTGGIIGNLLMRLGVRFTEQVTYAGDLVIDENS